MKKRIEMRLGDYRMIGKVADDGAVTVLVENVRSGWIDAEMTLGGDDADGLAPSADPALTRELLGQENDASDGFVRTDDGELAIARPGRAQVEPAPLEPSFPSRPGMTRSRVEPSDD